MGRVEGRVTYHDQDGRKEYVSDIAGILEKSGFGHSAKTPDSALKLLGRRDLLGIF